MLNDRPYVRVLEEHQSLAPVIDLSLRPALEGSATLTTRNSQLQSELLVVSGSNFSSKVNLVRKGISIKDHVCLEDLPRTLAEGGLQVLSNLLILRTSSLPEPIVACA